MRNQYRNARCLTSNVIRGIVLVMAVTLTFVGCVKPAASSSFLEKGQKEQKIASENQENTASIAALPESNLPPKHYTDLVKKYSDRYHLDWPLVLALMKQESRFDQEAVSYAGAYGLMQIMPITQTELVDKLGVTDAATPKNNIRAGVYHLKSMFRAFPKAKGADRVELALAAYNAGLARIVAAREVARYLGQDPNSWDVVKSTLPLLSHNYYSLHHDIWHENKPPCGYFGGYRQTVTYVENIMQYYDDYSLALK
jgi:membrane-bound lytic murein transglycosylase MltF